MTANVHLDLQENLALLDRLVPKENLARLALKENLALKEIPELKERLAKLENLALKENLALSDLLVRLENVVVSARQFWYHKTTLLHWMTIILALIVLDRLLLHFPQIVQIVTKLL